MDSQKQTPEPVASLAAEALVSGAEGATFEDRITRYTKARKRSRAVAGVMLSRPDAWPSQLTLIEQQAKKLRQCGLWMVFRHYLRTGDKRLTNIRTCRNHWLCEFCAIRRGAKSMSAYLDRFAVLRSQNPNLRPYLLTLTVKNGPDLYERFSHLRESLDSLRMAHKNMKRGMSHGSIFGLFQGGVTAVEITKSHHGWHPHVHIFAVTDCEDDRITEFLTAKNKSETWLSKQWEKVTGDSFIVDVRPIKADDESGLAAGAAEVFKYALKMSDLEIEQQIEAYLLLNGKRMLFSFGCFWGVKVPESETDELLADESEYEDLLYTWWASGYHMTRKITKEEIAQCESRESSTHAYIARFYQTRTAAYSVGLQPDGPLCIVPEPPG